MFIDYAKIRLRAGNGGAGIVAFHREKYIDKGGPSGGNGGRGGNIIFSTNPNLHTLQDIRYRRLYKAENGKSGGANKRTGKSGEDLIIQVPCGTIIKDLNTNNIVIDMVKENESHIVCQGGIGGRGNYNFKSSVQQTPRFAQEGISGEELHVELELKILADVGLVGLPNAGKSTLLSVMTTAKPKIADYPFTTLQPHLGIVKYGEYQSFVMADIPGLIEGASQGKGLGHQFLKHIERNRILLFLIDILEPNPQDVFDKLSNELSSFNKTLMDKPKLVVRTKRDTMDEAKNLENWKNFSEEYIDISSVSNTGLDILKDRLVSFLSSS
ncbi:GTPase ObgE [Candidatus Marinimicrobia bacterium]|nr:GTPase ObgE [Candidatus Neomarinimicrobiota bacterium]MDA9841656.1 GTPase ObgE [Candidatus Neomarinimicrobiota bacterium]MDC0521663.1 GTPase ObgE [Candidatus Neomarinimicrobiota bacterium]MDC0878879.1 GTPase ObgE [Candidatus Neomarinimicrobiota bacterium]MDC1000828.1 GTPase ObgE [Candidatus Neomarinimicrobiota bacterium]|tara:strand:- start:1260 stop:2237 length:978 start_codon:yes stop_codon:yes gene_type:complete